MAQSQLRVPAETPAAAPGRRGGQALKYAALVLLVGFLLHNADHVRRGYDATTTQVMWAGTVAAVLMIVAIGLALAGHRLAPLVAAVVGFGVALGVGAVHLAPPWGAFSDSLLVAGIDRLSWLAVLAEIGAALLFGAAGAWVLRGSRGLGSVPPG